MKKYRNFQNFMIKVMVALMLVSSLLPAQAFAMEQDPDLDPNQTTESSGEANDGEETTTGEATDEDGESTESTDPVTNEDVDGEQGTEEGEIDSNSETGENLEASEQSEADTNGAEDSTTKETVPEVENTEPEENEDGDQESDEDEKEDSEAFQLTVMHMNDTHGRLDPMPQMKTAIDEVRAEVDNSLVLHGGDAFTGTLYFNQYNGQADLAMLNLLGLDAMVYGNHEFDLGSNEGGHQSLSEFVKKANFPLLGTNLDFSKDPFMQNLEVKTPAVRDPQGGKTYHSIVKTIDGEEVGIFGLTTEDTVAISSPMLVDFLNHYESAEKAVKQFEAEGINKIVAVNHIGITHDRKLAEIDGLDVIVGGHSHTKLETPEFIEHEDQDPTVIVQAGEYTQHLGRLDVTFDENGIITAHDGELIPIEDQKEDEEVLEALQPFSKAIDKLENEDSGAVAVKDIENPRLGDGGDDSVRANETELGNLVTDAMLAKAKEKEPNTVIAVQNGGGIRAPISKGPITVGEIISVLPFGNDPVLVELSGAELKEILEHSVSNAPEELGGFLQVSGMKFTYDSSQQPGERVLTMEVENGDTFEPIAMDETYFITTNVFTAQGGDGFETFAEIYNDGRVTRIGEIDWEQLRDYMVEEEYLNGVVDPVREGRIIDIARDDVPDSEDPEKPGTPEDPEEPGTPGEPGEPGTPEDPEAPGTPGEPGEPGKPGKPGTPGEPGEPSEPSEPGAPADPEQPGESPAAKEVAFGETVEVKAGEVIEVDGTSISIAFPEDLPEGTKVTIKEVEEVQGNVEVAGDVVDVDLQLPEGHEDYEGSYELTLGVDEEYLDDDIAIHYFNEENEVWENRNGEVNEAAQTISVTVDHFSTYGVLAADASEPGIPGEPGEPGQPGTPGEPGEPGAPGEPGEPGTPADSNQSGATDDGKKLPSTATTIYTTLFIGSIILALGIGLYLLRRYKFN